MVEETLLKHTTSSDPALLKKEEIQGTEHQEISPGGPEHQEITPGGPVPGSPEHQETMKSPGEVPGETQVIRQELAKVPGEVQEKVKTLMKQYQETDDDIKKKEYEKELVATLNQENIHVTEGFLSDIKDKVKLDKLLGPFGNFIDSSVEHGFQETINNKLEDAQKMATGKPVQVIIAIIVIALVGLVSIIFSVLFLIGGILGALFALRMNPGKTGLARKSKIMLGFTWNWLYVGYGLLSYK